jgi:predicted porin
MFATQSSMAQDAREQAIINRLYRLTEIKIAGKYIDSLTHHKHGIALLTLKKPANTRDFYEIHAGYDSPERFETYFIYYIYGPKWVIWKDDPVTDKTTLVHEPV